MENILIFTSRVLAMQRMQDSLVHGYTHFTCGSLPIPRAPKVITKFDINYQVFGDRNLRARRKRANLGNANLILLKKDSMIHWWLFVTPPAGGDHAAHSLEKLRDSTLRDERVQIDGFELVTLPKKGTEKTKLTWRMTQQKYQDWRMSIIDTIRKGSAHAMHNMSYQLWTSPGFSGIRSQIGHLAALYNAEVKRASRKNAPALPKCLPYVRRLPNQGITLLQLLAETKLRTNAAAPVQPEIAEADAA